MLKLKLKLLNQERAVNPISEMLNRSPQSISQTFRFEKVLINGSLRSSWPASERSGSVAVAASFFIFELSFFRSGHPRVK